MYKYTKYYCLSNQLNLIYSINHKFLAIPLQCYWRYVKGQQDNKYVPLDRLPPLNVACNVTVKYWWIIYQETIYSTSKKLL